jgi:cytidine deaminase
MTDEHLLELAAAAAERAYAPYSNFRVGTVVVAADGSVYTGANVENAAYPSTLCAEATAIAHAVSSGVRKIDTVAVVCLDGPGCRPCGQCRQRMREFGVDRVVVEGGDGSPVAYAFEELLPDGFGPEHLP